MEQFYKEIYGGTALEGAQLTEFLARAEDQLRLFEHVYEVTEFVENGRKLALCAMAEEMYRISGSVGVASATLGAVRVQYKNTTDRQILARLYRAAGIYLDIYRGRWVS